MRRLLIAMACAAVVGCDDAEVATRALDVLEHGSVAARADCAVSADLPGAGTGVKYRAHKMQDGAAIMATSVDWGGMSATRFCARDEACADSFTVTINEGASSTIVLSVSSGDLVVDTYESSPQTFSVETYCTGFNLEAFGVE